MVVCFVYFISVPELIDDKDAGASLLGYLVCGLAQFIAMIVLQFRKPTKLQRVVSLVLGGTASVLGPLLIVGIFAGFSA